MVMNQWPKVSVFRRAVLEITKSVVCFRLCAFDLPPSLVVTFGLDPWILATLGLPPASRWLPQLSSTSVGERSQRILVVPLSHCLKECWWTSIDRPGSFVASGFNSVKQPSLLVNQCNLRERVVGNKCFVWWAIDSNDQRVVFFVHIFWVSVVSRIITGSHSSSFLVDIVDDSVEGNTIDKGLR